MGIGVGALGVGVIMDFSKVAAYLRCCNGFVGVGCVCFGLVVCAKQLSNNRIPNRP